MESLESRVTDLEIQICHQIKLLDELNLILIKQQKNLDEMTQFKKLILKELQNSISDDERATRSTFETKPPHY